jgi:hypothetical protein
MFRYSHSIAFLRKVIVVRDARVVTHFRIPLSSELGQSGSGITGLQDIGEPSTKWLESSTNKMRKYVKPDELISQAEAARIRGVSQQAIANLIRRGRLNTASVAGRTLVLRSEVESFVAKPKVGRPPKKATEKAPSKHVRVKKAKKRNKETQA